MSFTFRVDNCEKEIMSSEISPSVGVARGASYLFMQGVIGNIAGLIFLIYAARVLSVSEIGVISALAIILNLFMAFGTFAIPSAATKYISENVGTGRVDMAKGIHKKILRSGLLASFLSMGVCFGASSFISTFALGDTGYQLLIVILGLDVFALFVSAFLNGTLWGLQRFKEMAFAGVVAPCFRVAIAIFLLTLGSGLVGVVVGWVLGDFLGLGLLFFFTLTSFKFAKEDNTYPFRILVKYSLPLYVSGIVSYFSATIDKFVLLFSSGLANLGIYNVALSATIVVGLVASSISNALFPQFSQLYGGHGKKALEEASLGASRYVFLIYVPMAVGLATISLPTITLFFRQEYAPGWLPLTMISLTMALTSASVLMGSIFMSLGVTKIFLESNLLAIAAGTVLSLVLVEPFGIVGVTLAKVSVTVVPFLYFLFKLRDLFGLHFDWDAFRRSLIASTVMAGAVALLEFIRMSPYLLPLYILVGVTIYALMLRLTKAVNSQDIALMKQILPKSLGKTMDVLAKLLV